MFGCCVAGRLLQTNIVQVDETHAYFEISNASTVNHVCVFLSESVPFPDGFGAAVHFFWPGKGFQLLGMISNEKPSAIFRLKGTYSGESASAIQNKFSSYSTPGTGFQQDVTAILGLSMEPLASIQSQLEMLPNPALDLTRDPVVLAERIVKHLLNYIGGFISGGPMDPNLAIPMAVIQRWYEMFIGKVRAGGVGFLERGD